MACKNCNKNKQKSSPVPVLTPELKNSNEITENFTTVPVAPKQPASSNFQSPKVLPPLK